MKNGREILFMNILIHSKVNAEEFANLFTQNIETQIIRECAYNLMAGVFLKLRKRCDKLLIELDFNCIKDYFLFYIAENNAKYISEEECIIFEKLEIVPGSAQAILRRIMLMDDFEKENEEDEPLGHLYFKWYNVFPEDVKLSAIGLCINIFTAHSYEVMRELYAVEFNEQMQCIEKGMDYSEVKSLVNILKKDKIAKVRIPLNFFRKVRFIFDEEDKLIDIKYAMSTNEDFTIEFGLYDTVGFIKKKLQNV